MDDLIRRKDAIDLWDKYHSCIATEAMAYDRELRALPSAQPNIQTHLCDSCKYSYPDCPSKPSTVLFGNGVGQDNICACNDYLPSAQPEWNNHTVACLLAELFDDTCACNYNDIDEWLPEKCELLDSCPNPIGIACWEQFLKHKAERKSE